jgi:hypothetical protein
LFTDRWSALFGLAAVAGVPLVVTACGGTIRGEVTDYESGEPIRGATVTAVRSGWGVSNGQLVWDKDRSVSVMTDVGGAFAVDVRSGSSVKLRAQAGGYQRFEASYSFRDRPELHLKRRVELERRLPVGFLRLGVRDDGTMYGWDFSSGELATSPEEADIFPVSVDREARGPLTFRASGAGGVRFVPKEELGVDALFLVYTDRAPTDGYAETAVIDFESEGGVFFVRTRDGEHFAKFEFTPDAFMQMADPGVVRDLSLHYVYNPDGSRNLLYQMPE